MQTPGILVIVAGMGLSALACDRGRGAMGSLADARDGAAGSPGSDAAPAVDAGADSCQQQAGGDAHRSEYGPGALIQAGGTNFGDDHSRPPCAVRRLEPSAVCEPTSACPVVLAADIVCAPAYEASSVALKDGTAHATLYWFKPPVSYGTRASFELSADGFESRVLTDGSDVSLLVGGTGPLTVFGKTRGWSSLVDQIWMRTRDPATGWGPARVLATGPWLDLQAAGRDRSGMVHALWSDMGSGRYELAWWRDDGRAPHYLDAGTISAALALDGDAPAVYVNRSTACGGGVAPPRWQLARHERDRGPDQIVPATVSSSGTLITSPTGAELMFASTWLSDSASTRELDVIAPLTGARTSIASGATAPTGCLRPAGQMTYQALPDPATICPSDAASNQSTVLSGWAMVGTNDGAVWGAVAHGPATVACSWQGSCVRYPEQVVCTCTDAPTGVVGPPIKIFRASEWQKPAITLRPLSLDPPSLAMASEGTKVVLLIWGRSSSGRMVIIEPARLP